MKVKEKSYVTCFLCPVGIQKYLVKYQYPVRYGYAYGGVLELPVLHSTLFSHFYDFLHSCTYPNRLLLMGTVIVVIFVCFCPFHSLDPEI